MRYITAFTSLICLIPSAANSATCFRDDDSIMCTIDEKARMEKIDNQLFSNLGVLTVNVTPTQTLPLGVAVWRHHTTGGAGYREDGTVLFQGIGREQLAITGLYPGNQSFSVQLSAAHFPFETLSINHPVDAGGDYFARASGVVSLRMEVDLRYAGIAYEWDYTWEPERRVMAFPVPEAHSWAMTIVGFGAVGATLRRRRGIALEGRAGARQLQG